MKGTPYIYQGEEIGMTNRSIQSIDDVDDIESINMYKERLDEGYSKEELIHAINTKGRDNARTPVQWNATEEAGFTTGKPWLPVQPNYKHINIEAALESDESIFYTYKELITLRKENPIVVWGDYELLLPEDETLFAYKRSYENKTWLVLANVSKETKELKMPENNSIERVIMSNYGRNEIDLESIELQPFEAFVLELKRG